jgi:hypothetical protein
MDQLTRLGIAAALVIGVVLVAALPGDDTSGTAVDSAPERYNVSALVEQRPLDTQIVVTGNVSRVVQDYEAESGNVYQQFYLSDGTEQIKVFCSTAAGRRNISTGNTVTVDGTFQEVYGQDEIYTRCATIRAE